MPGYDPNEYEEGLFSLPFDQYIAAYIRHDAAFMRGVRAGVEAYREGRFRPWEEIRKELGLPRIVICEAGGA